MKFKKSMYNIEIEKAKDDQFFIYNSCQGSCGLMDKNSKELYLNIENIDKENIKDEETLNDLNIMEQNGFIVDAAIDEAANYLYRRNLIKYNTKASNLKLVIAPTLNCNMCCPYCFEASSSKCMTRETEIQLMDFIKESLFEKKELEILWFGGEPLLAKDIIKRLSKEIIGFCSENNITYQASIITNGYLLDEPTAKMLKEECSISRVQITIDGLENTHNARRVLKNGDGSFATIIRNIEKAKKYMFILIRVNVDKTNSDEMDKVIDYFIKELQWGKNDIEFYFAPVCAGKNVRHSKEKIFTANEYVEKYRNILIKMFDEHLDYNYDRLKLEPSLACGAEMLNYFVVGPEGDLYKCEQTLGCKDQSIGHVGDFLHSQHFNNNLLKWFNYAIPDKCTECNKLPTCKGGCAFLKIGDPDNDYDCETACHCEDIILKNIYREYF